MLKRKAYDDLIAWKRNKTRQGLLVEGARQVGKTTLIRAFARDHYDQIAEVNFYDNPQAKATIQAARDAKDLFLRISALSRAEVTENTLVFLDEIQECADVLTWLKFLAESKRCDFILSGSLLGLDSLDVRSLPVGFLQTLKMHPMDFEEFCWACGIGPSLLGRAREAFEARTPVDDFLHDELIDAFYRYLLIGGMPDAVQAFVDSDDLTRTRMVQTSIAELYRHDIAKYVGEKTEARQIRMIYESIPHQLNNPNKRFKFTRLGKNLRFANLETAFDWLTCAGVALAASRVSEPMFPLGLSEDVSSFKLYLNDVGLLTASLMRDVDLSILNRRSNINFGSIFENVSAQELAAHGYELHYYNSRKFGEIDFVVQNAHGAIELFEIKSGKDYRRHNALNNLLATSNYDFENVFVFYEGNVSTRTREQNGQRPRTPIVYLPIYMIDFVKP